uniref:Retrotransposon gag domain-containing protein n=1 Tax=Nothobranchius pienaari TaxID=704102 RepID=A0A1A8MTJ8_9TELE
MTFDKPESAAEVARQIWSLRQGKLSIADFAIEFRTLAATSTLDEASLKGAFTQVLNEQLQDQLAFCQEPPDLESLIALCSRMEKRHKARQRVSPCRLVECTEAKQTFIQQASGEEATYFSREVKANSKVHR